MTWFLTFLSIVGTILNIKQDRRGFYLWTIANVGWVVIDIQTQQYAQAVLFTCYLALSIWGLVTWKTKTA